MENDKGIKYAHKVKLLNRFYELYRQGRKERGVPQNYVDYFEVQHFLLMEVIKAYEADRSTQ